MDADLDLDLEADLDLGASPSFVSHCRVSLPESESVTIPTGSGMSLEDAEILAQSFSRYT